MHNTSPHLEKHLGQMQNAFSLVSRMDTLFRLLVSYVTYNSKIRKPLLVLRTITRQWLMLGENTEYNFFVNFVTLLHAKISTIW
jgi:hypothetical protein